MNLACVDTRRFSEAANGPHFVERASFCQETARGLKPRQRAGWALEPRHSVDLQKSATLPQADCLNRAGL